MGADRAEGTGGGSPPVILATGRHLHQIASDAWQALLDSNEPPRLFRYGGFIARIGRDDEGRPVVQQLGYSALRGTVDRAAIWVARGHNEQLRAVSPPKEVIEDMLAMEKPLPVLRGLTGTPVFVADGTLVSAPGYHEATRLFYEPLGAAIPDVPSEPSEADVERAKRLIFGEWFVDFPFADEASRAHAVGATLTPIARAFMTCPAPLHVFDAPTEGTGKGFLAESIGIVLSGREPSVMTEGRGEEEMRKRITAVLRDGRPVILLDNVKRRLDAAALASVLTTKSWTDRVLGKSETIVLPNTALWLATGNNIELDREIARRSVWIRLDAKSDRPWERTGFKHDPLLPWVFESRGELVWALLVLVRRWVVQGRPSWSGRMLGSYEDWCRVIGGILATAGIAAFLGNREELYRRVDAETEEWRAFVACWWQEHGDTPVKTGQLYDLAREWELLPSIFKRARDDASDRALKTTLGKALAKARDRRYGEYFIRHLGADGHQKGALYRLETAEAPLEPAEPPAGADPCSADVPQDNPSALDSSAEDAEHAEPVFNATREESTSPMDGEGTSKEVPHLPHVPLAESDWADFAAEHRRNLPVSASDVPRCWGCGSIVSVLLEPRLCGRCRQWGVVPEWAALVARRTSV